MAVCVFEGGYLEDVGCLWEGFAESGKEGRKRVSFVEGGEGEEGEIPRFYHLEKSTNGIEPRDDVCATCPCVGDDDDWPGEREELFEGLEVVSP